MVELLNSISTNTVDAFLGISWFFMLGGYYAFQWVFFNIDWNAIQKILNNGN